MGLSKAGKLLGMFSQHRDKRSLVGQCLTVTLLRRGELPGIISTYSPGPGEAIGYTFSCAPWSAVFGRRGKARGFAFVVTDAHYGLPRPGWLHSDHLKCSWWVARCWELRECLVCSAARLPAHKLTMASSLTHMQMLRKMKTTIMMVYPSFWV